MYKTEPSGTEGSSNHQAVAHSNGTIDRSRVLKTFQCRGIRSKAAAAAAAAATSSSGADGTSSSKPEPRLTSFLMNGKSRTVSSSDSENESGAYPTFKAKRKRSYSSSSGEGNIPFPGSRAYRDKNYSASSSMTNGDSHSGRAAIKREPVDSHPGRATIKRETVDSHPGDKYPPARVRPRFPMSSSESEPENEQYTLFTPTNSASEHSDGSVHEATPPPTRERSGRTAATRARDCLLKLHEPTKNNHTRKKSDDDVNNHIFYAGIPEAPDLKFDKDVLRSLPLQLQFGYKLYLSLRNDHTIKKNIHPFLNPVDNTSPETKNYYKDIEKPMCFARIDEKLEGLDYYSTKEIVADLRLIFENCYKFNGPEHWLSKIASKIEMSMEQRISVLPYSVRERCSLSETTPHLTLFRDVCGRRTRHPRIYTGSNQTPIMVAMEELQIYRERELKILKQEESKRKEEKIAKDVEWISTHLPENEDFKNICGSWMFITSCVSICVVQEAFNIPFTVLDLELGLMYPQHSTYLAKLIIHLCSSSKDAKNYLKENRLYYEFWNNLLRKKVASWYSLVESKGVEAVIDNDGVPREMFKTFGLEGVEDTPSPLGKKMFHELSTVERITLIYSLCSNKIETKPTLMQQFLMFESKSLRPSTLGFDALGNKYFHFPIWPEEIRIYVQLAVNNKVNHDNEIVCIARNTADLFQLAEKLQEPGYIELTNLSKKPLRSKGKSFARHTNQKSLIVALQALYESQIEHTGHHELVFNTVCRRVVESMMGQDLTPAKHPTTPKPDLPTDFLATRYELISLAGDDPPDGCEEANPSSVVREDIPNPKKKRGRPRTTDIAKTKRTKKTTDVNTDEDSEVCNTDNTAPGTCFVDRTKLGSALDSRESTPSGGNPDCAGGADAPDERCKTSSSESTGAQQTASRNSSFSGFDSDVDIPEKLSSGLRDDSSLSSKGAMAVSGRSLEAIKLTIKIGRRSREPSNRDGD